MLNGFLQTDRSFAELLAVIPMALCLALAYFACAASLDRNGWLKIIQRRVTSEVRDIAPPLDRPSALFTTDPIDARVVDREVARMVKGRRTYETIQHIENPAVCDDEK